MFEVFVPAGEAAKGNIHTQYDETINSLWREQVSAYITLALNSCEFSCK